MKGLIIAIATLILSGSVLAAHGTGHVKKGNHHPKHTQPAQPVSPANAS